MGKYFSVPPFTIFTNIPNYSTSSMKKVTNKGKPAYKVRLKAL